MSHGVFIDRAQLPRPLQKEASATCLSMNGSVAENEMGPRRAHA